METSRVSKVSCHTAFMKRNPQYVILRTIRIIHSMGLTSPSFTSAVSPTTDLRGGSFPFQFFFWTYYVLIFSSDQSLLQGFRWGMRHCSFQKHRRWWREGGTHLWSFTGHSERNALFVNSFVQITGKRDSHHRWVLPMLVRYCYFFVAKILSCRNARKYLGASYSDQELSSLWHWKVLVKLCILYLDFSSFRRLGTWTVPARFTKSTQQCHLLNFSF